MVFRSVALLTLIATAPQAVAVSVSDAQVLAIARKHCAMCHAERPTHESLNEAPKGIVLETVADLKKYASAIYTQTVQTKTMPLGNQSGMTDDERAALGQWLKGSQ